MERTQVYHLNHKATIAVLTDYQNITISFCAPRTGRARKIQNTNHIRNVNKMVIEISTCLLHKAMVSYAANVCLFVF